VIEREEELTSEIQTSWFQLQISICHLVSKISFDRFRRKEASVWNFLLLTKIQEVLFYTKNLIYFLFFVSFLACHDFGLNLNPFTRFKER